MEDNGDIRISYLDFQTIGDMIELLERGCEAKTIERKLISIETITRLFRKDTFRVWLEYVEKPNSTKD